MTTYFFFTYLFCCCFWIRDPGSEIRDPGSGIRDPGSGMGKNQDPGSGINIPDPQHWDYLHVFEKILPHLTAPKSISKLTSG